MAGGHGGRGRSRCRHWGRERCERAESGAGKRWVCEVKRRREPRGGPRSCGASAPHRDPRPPSRQAHGRCLVLPPEAGRAAVPASLIKLTGSAAGLKPGAEGFPGGPGVGLCAAPRTPVRLLTQELRPCVPQGGAKRKETPVRKANYVTSFHCSACLKCSMTICWRK